MDAYLNIKRFVLLTLLLILTACNGRNSQQPNTADIRINAAADSTQVGQTELIITLTDNAGNPISDAAISVKGDMNHAGMVPVLADATGGEDGVYKMPFEWTMGGDWVVTVDVVLADGRTASQQFDYTIAN